jgi:alanyl-tRNA synthetase
MPPGTIGGTTSEIFYEFNQVKHDPKYGNKCHPNCDCGRFLEIGNSVFMEYEKQADGSLKPLPQKNVDFGGGLERLAAAVQNTTDIFQIDSIKPLIQSIESATGKPYSGANQPSMRVIADHLRAVQAMLNENIEPSNKQQGYLLRRLIRRSAVKFRQLTGDLQLDKFKLILDHPVFLNEIAKFKTTLNKGLKLIDKTDPKQINEKLAFDLFQTYGFPFEITQEILNKQGIKLDKDKFDKNFQSHQQQSRTASAGMFKGGLKDQSAASIKLHTATHLLHQALRQVLGDRVHQQGSHITPERLRFDFTHDKPLTDQQIKEIENIVNQQIKKDLQVTKTIQPKNTALKSGALAFFQQSYPDQVTVYSIGDFSKELCGGPHVTSTGEIGGVKIIKHASIAAGKRRLYAILKNGSQKPGHQTQT